ncbi:MAG: hypothetical protein ACYSWS_05890 [Planctomycetota bacterium]|jgi:hypothetical protein
MNKIWLKKFIGKLNRSDGVSIMAIVVLMLIMTIMGGVFTSVMGRWKNSAPLTANSNRALELANTAAAFALQEASFKFYSKDASGNFNFNLGISSAPYIAYNDGNGGIADYWFEMPGFVNDDNLIGADADNVDDDGDDTTNPNRYTILATGRVNLGGTTIAKRQIKVFADITDNNISPIPPGVHAAGGIRGTGGSGFDIKKDGSAVSDVAFAPTNYADSTYPPASGSRAGVVYQNPASTPPILDSDTFKSLAKQQGHYYSASLNINANNFPNNSYYYDTTNTMPNIIFTEGDLSTNSKTFYGLYYVKGNVDLNGNYACNGIIICEGDVELNGGANNPDIDGGVIQLDPNGEVRGNGSPVNININNNYFNLMNNALPNISNVFWQQAVSAN